MHVELLADEPVDLAARARRVYGARKALGDRIERGVREEELSYWRLAA